MHSAVAIILRAAMEHWTGAFGDDGNDDDDESSDVPLLQAGHFTLATYRCNLVLVSLLLLLAKLVSVPVSLK